MKSVYSVRLDDDLVKEVKKSNLSLRMIFEEALEKIARQTKCPLCKQVKRLTK